MAARLSSTKIVLHREIGSDTKWWQGLRVPWLAYHGAQVVRWAAWRRIKWTGNAAAVWWLAVQTTLVTALLVWAAVWACIYVLRWRRAAEGGARSPSEIMEARDHEKRLRRQWPLACENLGLVGRGQKGGIPSLESVTRTAGGSLVAKVESGHYGVPPSRIIKATSDLRGVIGCEEIAAKETGPSRLEVTFHWRNPIERVLPLASMPVSSVGRFSIGITQDGGPASLKMNLSVLYGGLTEHGKSNAIHAGLGDLVQQEIPLRLYISDPKRGVEFGEYGRQLGAGTDMFQVHAYAKTPAATEEMATAMRKAMDSRLDAIERSGAPWTPTVENPLTILILDELLELDDTIKKGSKSDVASIVRQGRVGGYVVWALSQQGQIDTVGRLRGYFPQRVCFATRTASETDMFLGDNATALGARCHELREAGVGYMLSNSDRKPTLFRAALVTPEERQQIVRGLVPKDMADNREIAAGEQSGQVALYRYYELGGYAQGHPPLYIGITNDALAREAQHDADAREFMNSDYERRIEWFPTRKAALAAEKRAIETQRPRFNVQHNGRNPNRRNDKRRLKSAKSVA